MSPKGKNSGVPQGTLPGGLFPAMVQDDDPQETADWLEALDGVIETGGSERVAYLLTHSAEAESVARSGWERVRDNFLILRLLLDELKLVQSILA